MNNTNILMNIEEKIPTFSKGQKNIANYILTHYEKAAYMTATKLGIAAGVSESTVVRFAFELGYDGYSKLQLDLQEIIKSKLTAVQRIEVANDQIGDNNVLNKVLMSDVDKIKQTLEVTDKEEFNKIVDLIIEAKSIYILGARSSAVLARFLHLYFDLMFDNVKLIHITSSSEMFERIMRIGEGDLIIGISFPRYSKKTSEAMKFAKDRGATAIALTDSQTSPLAKHTDYMLLARSDMASFVDSLVAPLSIINALIVAVGLKKKEDLSKTFEELEHIWDEYDVYQKVEEQHEI